MITAPDQNTPQSALERFNASFQFANSTLPFVRRVVAEIVALSSEHHAIRSRLDQIEDHRQLEGSEALYSDEIRDIESSADRLSDQLKVCYDELDQIDGIRCSLSDPSEVDFICHLEHNSLYFCWKLDEEAVEFWHWSNESCAVRRPIGDFEEIDRQHGSMLA